MSDYDWMKRKNQPHLWQGVLAGVAGGLAASWVMNVFIGGVTEAQKALKSDEERKQEEQQQEQAGEDSTQKVADAITKAATGDPLSEEGKKVGGPVVHYVFGALMGGMYGAVAEYSKGSRMGMGTLFGSALFVGADEIMVPALGLGKKPTEQPVGSHLEYWAAHLVYGATTELVRRGVRKLL